MGANRNEDIWDFSNETMQGRNSIAEAYPRFNRANVCVGAGIPPREQAALAEATLAIGIAFEFQAGGAVNIGTKTNATGAQ